MPKLEVAVDHLLLGVADLETGIDWVENLTGVRAVPGGSHPGGGTRNALLALGRRQYLEIIAPDPAQTTYAFIVDVRHLKEPQLVTWAVSTENFDAVMSVARNLGFRASGPHPGSRMRPDGKLLQWNLVRLETPFASGPVQSFPFFIRWAEDSAHPSTDSPTGCELISLQIEHPDAERLRTALRRLGLETDVKRSEWAAINARLRTPNGEVELR